MYAGMYLQVKKLFKLFSAFFTRVGFFLRMRTSYVTVMGGMGSESFSTIFTLKKII